MKPSHLLLVLLVVAIWGTNFVAIKVATGTIPPIFLAGLRLFLTGIPFVFFIKKPAVRWRWLAAYGLTIFALNFGFLFLGMRLGMSAGITSLIFQVQIFFTIGLGILFFGEKIKRAQILSALVAFSGVIVIAINRGGNVTPLGLFFVLLACLGWAFGNMVSKKIGKVNILGLVIWGGFIACFPLLAFSYFFEGRELIVEGLSHLNAKVLFSIAYLVYPTTIVCFSIWSWLLNLYSTPTLLPFTLLVPVFGIFSSVAILKESFDRVQGMGAMLVFLGVSLNMLVSLKKK